jgi:2-phospho-L-lactate/phosphoenolpyruvate guanylyltransferase
MILVPVKNLKHAKQRLSALLTPLDRQALAAAMLEDVLRALAACSHISKIALVTGDPAAIRLAQQYSFEVIVDRENLGESEAVAMATRVCDGRGERETLVLPADIPLVTPAEIQGIFLAAPAEGTVIVPSRDDRGSNAVLRRPAALFPLNFGDDSFQPHLRAAQFTGKPCVVLRAEGIALDVDRPADLKTLVARPGSTRTQQLVRDWDIGQRLAAAAVPA